MVDLRHRLRHTDAPAIHDALGHCVGLVTFPIPRGDALQLSQDGDVAMVFVPDVRALPQELALDGDRARVVVDAIATAAEGESEEDEEKQCRDTHRWSVR